VSPRISCLLACLGASLCVALVACRSAGEGSSSTDASRPSVDASSPTNDAATIVDAAVDSGAIADAGVPRGEGELTLDVQGSYCPAERRTSPECRSYTYVLRTDGKLRGGKRRSDVPAEEVDAVFELAETTFAAKHACIPNPPDHGGQAILLRLHGKTQAARGGCGPGFQELRTRLERLAAGD
jgi:hypothetical protein